MISIASLIAAGITPTLARTFAEPLAFACQRFHIDTAPRVAAFIAQARHESMGFARTEENLYYTKPESIRQMWPSRVPRMFDAATLIRNPKALANRVYSLRNGNGDEASGDGWLYRGRGLFQLTGRANYKAAGDVLMRPYEDVPEMVAQPDDAALTAAWYWSSTHCNQLADAGAFDKITRAINGPAMHMAAERRELHEVALQAFA